jgi:hypothetical protein
MTVIRCRFTIMGARNCEIGKKVVWVYNLAQLCVRSVSKCLNAQIDTIATSSRHPSSHESKAHTRHDRSVRLCDVLDRTVGMQNVHNPLARGGLASVVSESVTANEHQVLFLLELLELSSEQKE